MAHLEHEQSKLNYQGAQLPLICFDELTHFSQSQFWYLVSRNRSMSGVHGYVRATCNPDADSWVSEFIEWWIDQDTGFPILERAGVLRWVLRVNDALDWADTREELIARWKGQIPDKALQPKSVTFIPAKLTDNKKLTDADPGYMANLLSLPTVERERLLNGNWKIRPAAGLYFRRHWLKPVEAVPADISWVRGWDLAATPKTDTNNPDFTESVLIGKSRDGRFFIADHTYMRGSPSEVEAAILNTAENDRASGKDVLTSLPQDPGQAGKTQAATFAKLLVAFRFRCSPESRGAGTVETPGVKAAKIRRFGPFSAQCEAGNVYYLKGRWNNEFFDRLEAFPEAKFDDTADATSRSYGEFLKMLPGQGMFDLARKQAGAKAEEDAKRKEADKPEVTYAIGSVEHAKAVMERSLH